jgi:hypothetical protein
MEIEKEVAIAASVGAITALILALGTIATNVY